MVGASQASVTENLSDGPVGRLPSGASGTHAPAPIRAATAPRARTTRHLLREFDPDGDEDSPVPDPYYGGIDGFEEVYRIVERSCNGLLASLEDGDLG